MFWFPNLKENVAGNFKSLLRKNYLVKPLTHTHTHTHTHSCCIILCCTGMQPIRSGHNRSRLKTNDGIKQFNLAYTDGTVIYHHFHTDEHTHLNPLTHYACVCQSTFKGTHVQHTARFDAHSFINL